MRSAEPKLEGKKTVSPEVIEVAPPAISKETSGQRGLFARLSPNDSRKSQTLGVPQQIWGFTFD